MGAEGFDSSYGSFTPTSGYNDSSSLTQACRTDLFNIFGGMMKFRFSISWFLFIVVLMVGLSACGGGDSNADTDESSAAAAGDANNGKTLFDQTCFTCHGEGGVGIEGLGKDMTTSTFIAGISDEELLDFIKTGRPIGDPLNTTNVDMPPKGGNPALTDDNLRDIIAYIRTIHK